MGGHQEPASGYISTKHLVSCVMNMFFLVTMLCWVPLARAKNAPWPIFKIFKVLQPAPACAGNDALDLGILLNFGGQMHLLLADTKRRRFEYISPMGSP